MALGILPALLELSCKDWLTALATGLALEMCSKTTSSRSSTFLVRVDLVLHASEAKRASVVPRVLIGSCNSMSDIQERIHDLIPFYGVTSIIISFVSSETDPIASVA